MPEGPEVETVKRTLNTLIPNKKIIDVQVYYEKIVIGDINVFKQSLNQQQVIQVLRKAKYLIFEFSEMMMVSHLRMEGKYVYSKIKNSPNKHEHVRFIFDDGSFLSYVDTRKFGRMYLVDKKNYLSTPPLSELGLDPSQTDANTLYQVLQKKRITIKQALLDQHIMTSLGNIYVDETLFLSKIHPTRLTYTITRQEAKTIVESATKILDKAILLGGTTIKTFESAHHVTGKFQNELLIHTKEGQPCPVCQQKIIKIKVGGRGTYVCERCQH